MCVCVSGPHPNLHPYCPFTCQLQPGDGSSSDDEVQGKCINLSQPESAFRRMGREREKERERDRDRMRKIEKGRQREVGKKWGERERERER